MIRNDVKETFTPIHQKRDIQLDMYRALVMIYIVCVIHFSTMMGMIAEPLISILLIEMPVVFFISGAAISVSKRKRSLLQVITGRAKRVVAPYYIYIIFSLLIAVAGVYLMPFVPNPFSRKGIVGALLMRPDELYFPHLWFVLPYLLIYILFVFERWLADRINRHIMMLLAIGLWGCSLLVLHPLVGQVAGYNIFFLAGYLYYKRCSRLMMLLFLAGGYLAFVCLLMSGYSFTPMNFNKFPSPNPLFISYGVIGLSVLSFIFSYVRIPENRLLRLWNDNGYSIYLWQNWCFFAYDCLLMLWIPEGMPGRRSYFALLVIFLLCTLSSIVIVRLERQIMRLSGAIMRRVRSKKRIEK